MHMKYSTHWSQTNVQSDGGNMICSLHCMRRCIRLVLDFYFSFCNKSDLKMFSRFGCFTRRTKRKENFSVEKITVWSHSVHVNNIIDCALLRTFEKNFLRRPHAHHLKKCDTFFLSICFIRQTTIKHFLAIFHWISSIMKEKLI